MRFQLFFICAGIVALAGGAAAQEPVRQLQVADPKLQATVAVDSMAQDLTALDASHAAVEQTANNYASLYTQLSDKVKSVVKIGEQLEGTSDRADTARLTSRLMSALREMGELEAALQQQFLSLQNQMQMESRQFNAVSNALKVRHDAAMAAIRNMK
ncbi:MAG TPA: hypothetical protein VLC48_01125 [Gemmatimonadota bacterium]|nr:hypothetical protein [Gemmatimonadota bacterium]